jgi:hypothetical protein
MFGCFRRLGCLVVLIILAVLAWFNRDRLESVYRRYAGEPPADTAATVAATWEPLSPEKAARGKTAVESLGRPRGPAYATLTAGEASSYIFEASRHLPAPPEEITTSIRDDKLYVRANIALRELGAERALGPLAGMLSGRDTVLLGGTMRVLRPGVGEFQIKDVKIGSFPVPSAVIPRLMRSMRRGSMPDSLSGDALPMTLPDYIGDIRISGGRITVYRNTR